jgi:iron complex outermembrane recepter protein
MTGSGALRRVSWPWLAICLLGLSMPGWAADHPVRYHIPAGSLDDALRTFASQSGAQLLYPPERTAGLRSRGLEGEYSMEQALATVLRDSGLRAESVASNAFVLRRATLHPPPVRRVAAARAPTRSTTLAAVEVTGTHIRRTRLEAAGPLTIITRRQIERSGYQTLYELLRAQPGIRVNNTPVAVSDGSAYQNNGLSGAIGASAVDLHGLGATATLFLIDGQRMAGYGLAQGEFGLVNNLDNIPLTLIERIEVLRDGASAIYGSDAMAGVINIILRKQFNGVALDQTAGVSTHGDARQWRDTATFGTTTAGGSHLLLSLDYLARSPLLGRNRAWALQAGRDATGPAGFGSDFFYFDNGQINHAGIPACSQAQPDGPCSGNAAAQTSLQTGLESRSLLSHFDHPLGPLTFYLDLRWTLIHQRQQMGPATEQLLVSDPSQASGYRQVTYAFNDIGPVRDFTLSRSNQLTLGLRGTPGTWAWDVRLDGQSNNGTDRVFGLLRTSVLKQALADGSYQPGSGDNRPAVLAQLSPGLMRTGRSTQTGFSARINGPVADWHGGPVSLAAGVESYRERLVDHPDPLLINNDVFQFQPPYVRRGDRWISAAYLELEAPIGSRLTANLAGRIDRSDGFGWAASPRLGLKWDISDSISLRGTLARGYRAPTLPELDRPQALTPQGVVVEVPDALLPCTGASTASSSTSLCMLRLDSVGNPRLKPERSRSVTLGLVLAPTPALGIALDFYEIHRFNEINALPVSYALMHPESYPQLFRRDAGGVLYAFDQQLVNLGHTTVRSYDLDMRYRLETVQLGRFTFNLGLDWLAELRRQVHPGAVLESYAGYAGQPRATALAGLEWSWRNWSVNGNMRYTGHYAFASSSDSLATCPTAQQQARHCETPAFALFDLGMDYAGFRHWRLGLHLHNLTDHRPVFHGYPAIGYSPSFDDVVGRYVLFSLRFRSRPAA